MKTNRRLIDLTENDLRAIVREEVAALLATIGLAQRVSSQEPCPFCQAGIAAICPHLVMPEGLMPQARAAAFRSFR